jgi:hypothetical protein
MKKPEMDNIARESSEFKEATVTSLPISFSLRVTFCAAVALLGAALSASGQVISVQREVRAVHLDVSPAVRDLPKVTSLTAVPHEAGRLHRVPLPPGLKPAAVPDSVLQRPSARMSSNPLPLIIRSFRGIEQGAYGFNIETRPPDTNGAAGLSQYVQSVNNAFAVFDKATGAVIVGPLSARALWSGFGGPCASSDMGDGIVVYDKLANRWAISKLAFRMDASDRNIPRTSIAS